MLSAPNPSTPKRPLPPAKMRRRAPSLPPPPPYDDAGGDLEGDALAKDRLQPPLDDWISEKSREELSGLLLAAGGMIKDRETGACSYSPTPHSLDTDASYRLIFFLRPPICHVEIMQSWA